MQAKTKYKYGKRPLLIVEWEDIMTYSLWQSNIENVKPCPCISIGWRVPSDNRHVVLTSMKGEDAVSMLQLIPKGCIRSITRIKEDDLSSGTKVDRDGKMPA